jgi:polar amino acid transport system substrate-binding protein
MAAAGMALIAAAPALSGAQAPITLHAQERPPYSTPSADGRVHGLVADPAARAFDRAGVAFVWTITPSQRQMAIIQAGQGHDCGIGWFRNPEREAIGKFTRPIYQDQPLAALTLRAGGIRPDRSVADLLADAGTPLLVKDGYSYGPALDPQIALFPANVRRTSAESAQMVRMIAAGRAAWMIVAPEEASVLLAELGADAARLHVAPLRDVPVGQPRHILCSKAVPDSVVERLNRALSPR